MPKEPNMTRRDFFRGKLFRPIQEAARRGAAAGRGVAKQDLSLTLLQRPPGAVAEGQFLASCTRCGDCVTACPPQAIRWAPPESGERRAGTPFIDAIRQSCVMCSDTPCITACEPGVLRSELPLTMATARVDAIACLAWRGQPCRLCVDQCPVDGVISVDAEQRPIIDPGHCTGCGVCVQVCPAPRNAIDHRPLGSRPFWHG
ncbi:MAG: 4Fe-4S dicluster domain-containing protein [Planctomycetes bacterium]|nr:4Fe-4S dicluster domain-containing protein [Planctomycetota bacterium]MCP4838613.1 4Fe-4S dicluster domain-containing protein [Planctomycetota bacterium]